MKPSMPIKSPSALASAAAKTTGGVGVFAEESKGGASRTTAAKRQGSLSLRRGVEGSVMRIQILLDVGTLAKSRLLDKAI